SLHHYALPERANFSPGPHDSMRAFKGMQSAEGLDRVPEKRRALIGMNHRVDCAERRVKRFRRNPKEPVKLVRPRDFVFGQVITPAAHPADPFALVEQPLRSAQCSPRPSALRHIIYE